MGRPRERSPLFGGVYVLVPIWLGAPRPAWPPKSLMKRGLPGFLGRYLVTVYVRMVVFLFSGILRALFVRSGSEVDGVDSSQHLNVI